MEQILEQIKGPALIGLVAGISAGLINHYCAKRAVENLKVARGEVPAEAEK